MHSERPPVAADDRWIARDIGREQALLARRDRAVLAFGIGPVTGGTDQTRRLSALLDAFAGALDGIATCRQIHGSLVHRVDEPLQRITRVGEGDGLVVARPGRGVAVWTADCVPVLLYGGGVVAAIHSGWRGCAADVVGAAVEEVSAVAGVAPQRLGMALGPAVCGDCYTVGRDVVDALATFDLDSARWRRGDRVDLRGFLTARGEALGIPPERIESIGGCTVESPALASYRRDGAAAGRQWSLAFLTG